MIIIIMLRGGDALVRFHDGMYTLYRGAALLLLDFIEKGISPIHLLHVTAVVDDGGAPVLDGRNGLEIHSLSHFLQEGGTIHLLQFDFRIDEWHALILRLLYMVQLLIVEALDF